MARTVCDSSHFGASKVGHWIYLDCFIQVMIVATLVESSNVVLTQFVVVFARHQTVFLLRSICHGSANRYRYEGTNILRPTITRTTEAL